MALEAHHAGLERTVQAGAQPIILILNNGIYGTIRAHQERNYPARVSGTTLENPDFAALAPDLTSSTDPAALIPTLKNIVFKE